MKFVQRAGVVAGAVAWMLAGCGGGAEESAGTSSVREKAMALEAAAQAMTLTGTAASGDALAGATVTAKCANHGGGTAVVNAKGRYTLKATGALPCVLEVPVASMGLKLHGALVKGRAANLTPLTELALARMAAGSAAALFDNFDNLDAAAPRRRPGSTRPACPPRSRRCAARCRTRWRWATLIRSRCPSSSTTRTTASSTP